MDIRVVQGWFSAGQKGISVVPMAETGESISAGQKQFMPGRNGNNRKYMPLIGKCVLFIEYVVSLVYLSTCDKHLSCPAHNKQQTSQQYIRLV